MQYGYHITAITASETELWVLPRVTKETKPEFMGSDWLGEH